MKKGSDVRLIQPVVEGKVVKVKYDEDADTKQMCVEFKDKEGDVQSVWFEESQLKEVKA